MTISIKNADDYNIAQGAIAIHISAISHIIESADWNRWMSSTDECFEIDGSAIEASGEIYNALSALKDAHKALQQLMNSVGM